MISAERFLEIFPVFRESPDGLVSSILSAAQHRKFPAEMLIYSEGGSCSAIAFLLSGEIRVFKSGAGGREISLYHITKGQTCILNASCILSGLSYPANAVTVREGEMLLLPAGSFRKFIDRFEDMRNFVFTILSQRLSHIMALVEEVAFRRMDERVREYLTEHASDGFLNTTHQKIADDLGSSREVISRLLKDFETAGNITLSRNQIRINKL